MGCSFSDRFRPFFHGDTEDDRTAGVYRINLVFRTAGIRISAGNNEVYPVETVRFGVCGGVEVS
jgi:hypothetical protein